MTENSKEQTITWRDVYKQLNKVSVATLNLYKLIQGECGLNSPEVFTSKEVYSWIELEEHLVGSLKPAGLCNRIAFRNLLFIQIGENFWTVHHKNYAGEIKHFDTIDFTLFSEVYHFPALIEEMLKGPEHYWGVSEFKEAKEGFLKRLIICYIKGKIKPIQEEENRGWINYEGRVANSTAPTMSRDDAEMLAMTPTLKYQDTLHYEVFDDDCGVPYAPVTNIERLQSDLLINSLSNVQRLGYGNLVFCKMTDSGIWAVYHHSGDGNLRHFVNIDFVPFVENGIFHYLIQGLDKGPEYFWNVDKFEQMPISKADRILLNLANLSSEERKERIDLEWMGWYPLISLDNKKEQSSQLNKEDKIQQITNLENRLGNLMKELRETVEQL